LKAFNTMKRFLVIPEFEDQDKQRRANILVVTLFAVILLIPGLVLYSMLMTPEHSEALLMGGTGVALVVISYALLRKGRIEAACWLVVGLGWLIFSLDLAFIAGIRGVSILGQLLIVIFAGLAISGKSALVITLLTLVVNFIILQLELAGLISHLMPLAANSTRWFNQTAYTILAAFYIWVADRYIRNALSESRETADRYRALFERTNDGVVIFDLDWKVLSANHQAEMMLGYTLDELMGLEISEWEDPDTTQSMKKNRDMIINGENLPLFEESLIRKDGISIPAELSMALVHDADGHPSHVQCIMRDITERMDYQARLERQALYDPLTNLPNRALIEDRFLQVYKRDDQTMVAVLFMDLDNFKWVNDEYGHAVGDKVLQKLGKRLLSSLRESDVVARLGGDEFVIILENIRTKDDVRKIAKKLLGNISQPILVEGHTITVTASIGINIADDRNLPYVDLLKKSDFAMYQVKDSGKNDYRFYTSENQV
jgi:diguanylate cyclase (GGDEF)-like protein/PAS domain S-box-containing protein